MTVTTGVALSPQLAEIQRELRDARERAHALCDPLDARRWGARPSADRWAVGECLTHLTITSERFLPLIDDAIRDGRARRLEHDGPYRVGLMGWSLLRYMEPPYRITTRTPTGFVPVHVDPKADTLERFDYLQTELQARVDRSAGLALDRLRLVSPFDQRVTYNLYAAFRLIAAHERRHLWQAERTSHELSKRP